MPKANLTLPNGTVIVIEGTTDEVSRLLSMYSAGSATKSTKAASGATPKAKATKGGKTRKGPTAIILELRDEGFFDKKRGLADIQAKLEEGGHIYARKSIAQLLLQVTRRKELRRLKEGANWDYVKP